MSQRERERTRGKEEGIEGRKEGGRQRERGPKKVFWIEEGTTWKH